MRAIGAELGADYVLEGSVRWARDSGGVGRLRVTPQLIRVGDDSHLWAATYEAALGEVFRLQSEIAERVTTALDVALRAPERAALAAVGTRNPEAYDFYLRGNEYVGRGTERSDVLAAIDLYQRAVGLDSTFAAALAKLARAEAAMYWFYYDHSPGRLARAKRAADAAVRFGPDLAEARVALGYYYYWGHLDYDRALREFEAARRLQPSNSDVLGAIGYVERRRGHWDAAVARFREAIEVDPVSQQRAFDLGDTYLTLRKYPEAERQLDRTIQLAPDWAKPYGYKAMLYLMWKGDRQRARAVIGQAMSRVSTGPAGARPDDRRRHLGLGDLGRQHLLPRGRRRARRRVRGRYRRLLPVQGGGGALPGPARGGAGLRRLGPAVARAAARGAAGRRQAPGALRRCLRAGRAARGGGARRPPGRPAPAAHGGRGLRAVPPDLPGADLRPDGRPRPGRRDAPAHADLSELDHAGGADQRSALGAAPGRTPGSRR